MTLTQLRYIVAVDTWRHFVRAAEECGVTQPTLSMQIRKLERELGVEIFDRARHPVEPTDLGRRIVAQARVVLAEAAALRELAEEAGGVVEGELRVGVIPTVAAYLLPRVLPPLGRRHGGLRLRIEELQTDQILEALEADRLDAGLVATSVDVAGVVERALYEEPFFAYVSEDHPAFGEARLHPESLRVDDLWLLHEGHCLRDQVLQLCGEEGRAAGGSARPRFESGHLETLKRLVETSGGMTLLPALALADLTPEQRRRVRPFADPSPSRTVRLVHRRTYLRQRRIAAFEEVVREVAAAELRAPRTPSSVPAGW